MRKRKKETQAQQKARAEYMRLRRNIQAQQRREMKKYGTIAREMPAIPERGLNAREIRKATKYLTEYRKTQFDVSMVEDSKVIIENFRIKVHALPTATHEGKGKSSGEIDGKDILSEWVDTLINTVGENRTAEIIRVAESQTGADKKIWYQDDAEDFINIGLVYALENETIGYEESDTIRRGLNGYLEELTDKPDTFTEWE